MERQDRHGLLMLAILVALLVVAGWFMMRGSRASMRENAVPDASQSGAPGSQGQTTTRP